MKTTIRENGRERTIYHGPGYPLDESRQCRMINVTPSTEYSCTFDLAPRLMQVQYADDAISQAIERATNGMIQYADEVRVMTEDHWNLLLTMMQPRAVADMDRRIAEVERERCGMTHVQEMQRGNSQEPSRNVVLCRPANHSGIIRDREERQLRGDGQAYRRWLKNIKNKKLPPISKAACDVTPIFLKVD